MASRMATKGMAVGVVAGIGITAAAFWFGQPKQKDSTHDMTVHGTAKHTQEGFIEKEPGLDSHDVRKVVQGKNPSDKY